MPPRGSRPDADRVRTFLRRAGSAAGPPGPSPPQRAPDGSGTDDPRGVVADAPAGDGAAGAAPPPLDALRRLVARLEGRMETGARLAPDPGGASRPGAPPDRLALGVAGFDVLFPAGGLAMPVLTEIRAPQTRHAGAATGFLAALLVLLGRRRPGPVLWACDRRTAGETGRAAGLGLLHLGLDPSRLLVVGVDEPADLLWAAEEGLGCPGLAAVVAEIHGLPRALDLTASRRLALRARESGVPMLLAGHATPEAASAAATRLSVVPRLSRPAGGFTAGPGFPAWTVTVEKNRDGRTGQVDLEWNCDDGRFRELVPVPLAVAAGDPDRSPRPAPAGQVLAHPGRVRRLG